MSSKIARSSKLLTAALFSGTILFVASYGISVQSHAAQQAGQGGGQPITITPGDILPIPDPAAAIQACKDKVKNFCEDNCSSDKKKKDCEAEGGARCETECADGNCSEDDIKGSATATVIRGNAAGGVAMH